MYKIFGDPRQPRYYDTSLDHRDDPDPNPFLNFSYKRNDYVYVF